MTRYNLEYSNADGIIKYPEETSYSVSSMGSIYYTAATSEPDYTNQDGMIQYKDKVATQNGIIRYSIEPVDPAVDGAYNEDLVVTVSKSPYSTGGMITSICTINFKDADVINSNFTTPWFETTVINNSINIGIGGNMLYVQNACLLNYSGVGILIINVTRATYGGILSIDSLTNINWGYDDLIELNTSLNIRTGVSFTKFASLRNQYYDVNIYGNTPDGEIVDDAGYIPSGTIRVNNFKNTSHDGVIMNVKGEVSRTVGAITPLDIPLVNLWSKNDPVNSLLKLTYGYGVQNFLVGGVVDLDYDYDPYVPPPVITIDHPTYKVFRYMTNALMYLESDMSIIGTTSCKITYDLDTFTWKLDVTLASQEDYVKIKPVGSVYQTVEVVMNTVKFKFFISSVNRSSQVDNSGKVTYTFVAVGYSLIKALAAPHASTRSYSADGDYSAASLVQQEVLDRAMSTVVNWDTANWTVPFGVHSYQGKTPVGAMLLLINAVGCAMYPDPYLDEVTVLPYYRDRPWNWKNIQPDHTIHIGQFLNDSDNAVSSDIPNAVFVYGEGDNAVGVEVGLSGTQATNVLPDVVDKYLTDTDAAIQRGLTELAKVSRLEELSLTTYVDTTVGLFYPRQVIEVTDWDGVTKWYGQVMGTSISMSRIGAVITQTITVHKFHES